MDGIETRRATPADVDRCFGVQRRSALRGYAHIFPQDRYPFPDELVRAEWERRLAHTWVCLALAGDEPVATVAAPDERIEALFVVPERWGTGLAQRMLDEALSVIASRGARHAELDVMVDNARARRFYEKHGWAPDGRRDRTPWPPYPEIVGYRFAFPAGNAPHATIGR